MKNNRIKEMYLDYFNNFLTVDRFAEYYNISKQKATYIINKGRSINHKNN